MQEQLKEIRERVLAELAQVSDTAALEQLRVKAMGKKGELTAILRGMGKLSPEERPVMGQLVNEVREELEKALEEKAATLKQKEKEARLAQEAIDVTVPGK